MDNPIRKLKKILFILGITGAVYLGFRYLLPLVVPFLCAYGAALWLRPSIKYLEQKIFRGKNCKFSSLAVWIGGVELLTLFAAIGCFLYWIGSRLLVQLEQFSSVLPQWFSWLETRLSGVWGMLEAAIPAIVNNSMNVITWFAEGIIFLVIFVIAALMFLREMEEIREKKSRSIFHRELSIVGWRVGTTVGAWIKTEFVILSVNSVLFVLGLFLIRNEYALLLGIGIGLLDALPFVGAGIILAPWGIFLCIRKNWFSGVVLLAMFGIAYVLRQMLEARIMGEKVGLSPVETLISMYVGIRLFGLVGFLLGPLGLLIIEDLTELYWKEE